MTDKIEAVAVPGKANHFVLNEAGQKAVAEARAAARLKVPPVAGPYTLCATEPVVIDGVERLAAKLMRENDGSLVIMAPDPDEASDRRRIAAVNPTSFTPKRGKGWEMTREDDPEQMATARLFLASPTLRDVALELIYGGGSDASLQLAIDLAREGLVTSGDLRQA